MTAPLKRWIVKSHKYRGRSKPQQAFIAKEVDEVTFSNKGRWRSFWKIKSELCSGLMGKSQEGLSGIFTKSQNILFSIWPNISNVLLKF